MASINVLLFFLLSNTLYCSSDTVVGCGGFIRWNDDFKGIMKIDYEKIKVQLHSEPENILKDVTDVLPNGAFSMPLYDLGLYRLTLAAPSGWHVSPSDGHVINLKSDPNACSRDFDFYLLGFGIYGQVVTYGMTTGPAGLVIRLVRDRFEKLNTTQSGGFFCIAPVQPGTYELSIRDTDQNGSERFRAKTSVSVGSDNVVLPKPIMMMGHFIRGHAVDLENQPLVGAIILLFVNTSVDTTMLDCDPVNATLAANVNVSAESAADFVPMCVCKTDAGGYFSFDRLPGGQYQLLPIHSVPLDNGSITYAFQPEVIPIAMGHSDVDLGISSFRVVGVRLPPGRLLWPDGTPIAFAEVYFETQGHPFVTDASGFYQPGFLQPGSYTIRVNVHGAKFKEHHFHLSQSSGQLPVLQPHMLALCGAINFDEKFYHSHFQVSLLITNMATNKTRKEFLKPQNETLRYCSFVPPGHYEISADMRITHPTMSQVQLTPTTVQVDVSRKPISNVLFTQFRAQLRGRMVCLTDRCVDSGIERTWQIHLISLDHEISLYSKLKPSKEDPKVNYFELFDILPGVYNMDVVFETKAGELEQVDGWCWLPPSNNMSDEVILPRRIHVPHTDLSWETDPRLDFVQSGYAVLVNLSVPTTFYNLPQVTLKGVTGPSVGSGSGLITWELRNHLSKICLPQSNVVYKFEAHSTCLTFGSPNPLSLYPKTDCHASLARTPVIHLYALKAPLLVRFSFEEPLDQSVIKSVTMVPLFLDMHQSPTDSFSNRSSSGKNVETVTTKWFSSGEHVFAEAMVWYDIDSVVTFRPRLAPHDSSGWFYTYTCSEPQTLRIDSSQLTYDTFTTDTLFPMLTPLKNGTAHSSASKTGNDCMNLFPQQRINFTLQLAAILRGQIQPAVPEVVVELYDNSLTQNASASDQTLPAYRQPFLPVHESVMPPSRCSNQSGDCALSGTNDPNIPSSLIAATLTDSLGMFSFGPIRIQHCFSRSRSSNVLPDPSGCFKITLRRPGYEFTELRSDRTEGSSLSSLNWMFTATKLSLVEVVVKVKHNATDEVLPLAGVLVSLIGENHRENQFTDKLGVATFIGLVPGQYYLRAMLKEHVFRVIRPHDTQSGSSASIVVTEGISVHAELLAERVAFSASGTITSLGHLPLGGVLVEAQWLPAAVSSSNIRSFESPVNTCRLVSQDASNVPREQSRTDHDGRFLIRGLLPDCTYIVTARTTPSDQIPRHCSNLPLPSDNPIIDRTIPPYIHLIMPHHDAVGLTFIALPQMYMSTVTIDVDTEDEFVPALHLTVFPSDHPKMALIKHDFSSSLIFRLSGPMMSRVVGCELVARLENSLDPTVYTDIGPKQIVFQPKANISEYYTLVFRPRLITNIPRREL